MCYNITGDKMKKIYLTAFICILIDQIIKYFVTWNIEFNYKVDVIKNFFSLTNVHNTGAAWSILSGNRIILILITIIALNLIYFFFIKDKKLNNKESILYGLLIGGIIGNLVDRLLFGYVIDYLSFNFFGYYFPVFNFADTLIVLSSLIIFIIMMRNNNEENNCK